VRHRWGLRSNGLRFGHGPRLGWRQRALTPEPGPGASATR